MEIKIKDVGYMREFLHSTLYNLKKRIIEREYDLKLSLIIYNVYVEDAQKSGTSSISLEKQ